MTLYSDGSLRGNVIDDSEQLVLGALTRDSGHAPTTPPQRRDPGLNPIMLIPVSADIATCEELMGESRFAVPPGA